MIWGVIGVHYDLGGYRWYTMIWGARFYSLVVFWFEWGMTAFFHDRLFSWPVFLWPGFLWPGFLWPVLGRPGFYDRVFFMTGFFLWPGFYDRLFFMTGFLWPPFFYDRFWVDRGFLWPGFGSTGVFCMTGFLGPTGFFMTGFGWKLWNGALHPVSPAAPLSLSLSLFPYHPLSLSYRGGGFV